MTILTVIEISLSKFSQYSVDEIIKKIIHCDNEVLENVVLMDFLQRNDLCEIPDNVAKLMAPYSKDWTGPNPLLTERESNPEELSREDQLYLYTSFELHHYWKARMRALALTKSYEKDYDDISQSLQKIVEVSDSVRDSVKLMNVLGLILDIGNYMNDANKQATGFKLSTLARLGMVKDEKNESNFADLVERITRTQYPAWEGFVDEIWGVVLIQKVNVEQIRTDAKKYIDTINKVQQSLDSGNLSDPKRFHPEDRVSHIVQRAMKEARRKAEQLQVFLDDMSKNYEEIMAFYGEDASDENARRDFFSKLAGFVVGWKASKEKNLILEENKKRNEASMRRKQQSGHVLANGNTIEPMPKDTGAMDSLMEKLRAAAPQTKDQRDRRRRARLKDRHQDRVASGQQIPDLPTTEEDAEDQSVNSPETEEVESFGTAVVEVKTSEKDGIADRAASMLQGLRGDGESEASARQRRESLDGDRARRRRRNKTASIDNTEPIVEEAISTLSIPTTVISPPSPHDQ